MPEIFEGLGFFHNSDLIAILHDKLLYSEQFMVAEKTDEILTNPIMWDLSEDELKWIPEDMDIECWSDKAVNTKKIGEVRDGKLFLAKLIKRPIKFAMNFQENNLAIFLLFDERDFSRKRSKKVFPIREDGSYHYLTTSIVSDKIAKLFHLPSVRQTLPPCETDVIFIQNIPVAIQESNQSWSAVNIRTVQINCRLETGLGWFEYGFFKGKEIYHRSSLNMTIFFSNYREELGPVVNCFVTHDKRWLPISMYTDEMLHIAAYQRRKCRLRLNGKNDRTLCDSFLILDEEKEEHEFFIETMIEKEHWFQIFNNLVEPAEIIPDSYEIVPHYPIVNNGNEVVLFSQTRVVFKTPNFDPSIHNQYLYCKKTKELFSQNLNIIGYPLIEHEPILVICKTPRDEMREILREELNDDVIGLLFDFMFHKTSAEFLEDAREFSKEMFSVAYRLGTTEETLQEKINEML
jgi:hypothetical protein